MGNLCSSCDKGYSRQGKAQCRPCPSNRALNNFICFLGFAGVLAVVGFLVKQTLRNGKETPYFGLLAARLSKDFEAERVTIFNIDQIGKRCYVKAVFIQDRVRKEPINFSLKLKHGEVAPVACANSGLPLRLDKILPHVPKQNNHQNNHRFKKKKKERRVRKMSMAR